MPKIDGGSAIAAPPRLWRPLVVSKEPSARDSRTTLFMEILGSSTPRWRSCKARLAFATSGALRRAAFCAAPARESAVISCNELERSRQGRCAALHFEHEDAVAVARGTARAPPLAR
eukprot:7416045-Pyramimonas_sp.AAC.1